MISILILTKNEEVALPGCLESVAWSDDVHVYDSGSTDRTAAIAAAAGAHFTLSPNAHNAAPFGNDEAELRNRAIKTLPFKYPWVLYVDADERPTEDLVDAALAAVAKGGENVGYRLQRRDFFMNTWLKHVQVTSFYLRLFQHAKVHFERSIHSACVPEGPISTLPGYLDHFPFSKGIAQWLSRHNDYSTLEARHIVASRASKVNFSFWKAFTAKDIYERRFHQKEIFYRIPGRPLLKFLMLYIAKRGFMDGRAGFTYSILICIYEYMIMLKTSELSAPPELNPSQLAPQFSETVSKSQR